jgi:hypothetical protein
MNEEIIYHGKENDVIYKVCMVDGQIDEIQIQNEGETCWRVLGFDDLNAAVSKAYIR